MATSGNKFEVEITGKMDGLEKAVEASRGELEGLGKAANGMSAMFKAVGGAMAAAFTIDKIADFTQESIKLAAETEGVEAAFNRIAGANIDNLRKSVQGTVSDLALMKAAVNANNFKIPIEQLGTFFEFATKRAAQTGQSVDYLVESIILGIGRKSPLILDNLGISAIALKEKFGEVGMEAASVGQVAAAMGEIVQEELVKMGDVALTTAQRMAQVTAQTENLKVEIGEKLTPYMNMWYKEILLVLKGLDAIFNLTSGQEKGANLGVKMFETFSSKAKDADHLARMFQATIAELGKEAAELQRINWVGYADTEAYQLIQGKIEGLTNAYINYNNQQKAAAEAARLEAEALKKKNAELAASARHIQKITDVGASPLAMQAATSGLPTDLGGGAGVQRTVFMPEFTPEQIQAFSEVRHGMEEYNNTLWLTQNLTAGIGTAFADAIVSGADFGEAMKQILAETLKQLIAMVVQAAALAAIMSVLTGGGTGFGAIFNSIFGGLTSGGGTGLNITGVLQGSDINLSAMRAGYQSGRR